MAGVVFDVAIVGFGPSGAVAAALLGQAGHRVYVCDRSTEVYAKPRAIALDHEIMRVFQQLGLAAAIEPHTEPFTDSCYYGADGRLIRRMTMVALPYPQAWTPSMVFTQPAVDAEVRTAVARLPNVRVELGVEVIGLQQDADSAMVTLADNRHIRARWVIACDGASSTLRGLVGIALDDLGFDEPWLVVDVLANQRGLAKLPPTSVQYCEPARPCTLVIGPKNHRRWEISLNGGDDPHQAETPEGTWALLKRWITPEDGQLWRQASYRFHALVAHRWRAGRVFIAGDAAHQQPPFLGQGMCQGIRDVFNLAWKLDAVLKGEAGDVLLDSYGIERGRHVRELTTRLKSIGALIGERDAARAHARDERLLAEAGGTVRPTPRQDVLPRLEGGALARDDSPARGALFPQPWLQRQGQRVRMDDVVGIGWHLVLRDAALAHDAVLPGLRTLTLPDLNEADGVLAAWFHEHRCAAALVRPDHYVFGTAADTAGVLELVAQARAALN
jgi:3-(3-hydroxy-phenyl)propionate hydroxylase